VHLISGPLRPRIIRSLAGAAAVLVVAGCGGGPSSRQAPRPTAAPSYAPLVPQLAGEVSADGALVHLQALQQAADQHGGNRASGTPGYDASVDHVVGVLRGAGFDVSTPTFRMSGDDDGAASGTARNVVAQTATGDPDHVVMIGAHLDSAEEGPGIVDNGSGVASLLEIATRLGTGPAVRNTVRFAFFGGEETGSDGARAYLRGLSPADRAKIELYLNVDMVASPNAGYFVQGGQGRDSDAAGPAGSAVVAEVLADQLAATGVTAELIEFVGDDESPFIDEGIPVAGAENGDEDEKTAAQATAWGGRAGQVYDPCYHSACDRIDNVDRVVLDHYLRALAGTVAHFATSTDELR
jgi:aminopeptidase S